MSALDRDKARVLIEGYINSTLHALPETRAAVEGTLDQLEKCVLPYPITTPSLHVKYRRERDAAEAKLAAIRKVISTNDEYSEIRSVLEREDLTGESHS